MCVSVCTRVFVSTRCTAVSIVLCLGCVGVLFFPGPLLTSIEEDMLAFLVGELKLRSQNLIQELKKTVDGLRVEPTDFNDFTQYASMVSNVTTFCSHGSVI